MKNPFDIFRRKRRAERSPEYPIGSVRVVEYWNDEIAEHRYRLDRYEVHLGPLHDNPYYLWEPVEFGDLDWARRQSRHYDVEIEGERYAELSVNKKSWPVTLNFDDSLRAGKLELIDLESSSVDLTRSAIVPQYDGNSREITGWALVHMDDVASSKDMDRKEGKVV